MKLLKIILGAVLVAGQQEFEGNSGWQQPSGAFGKIEFG